MRFFVSIFLILVLLSNAHFVCAGEDASKAPKPWFTETLRQERITLEPENLFKELRYRTIGTENILQVEALVKQLGNKLFQDREEATHKLLKIGPSAAVGLKKATFSKDLEIATRARIILGQLKSPEQFERDQIVIYAILKQIANDHAQGATPLLLKIMPFLELAEHRYVAQEAIWQTVQTDDKKLLEDASSSPHVTIRAAAIVALTRLDQKAPLPKIKPFLADADPTIRLAACRALLNNDPRVCLPVLAELTTQKDSLCQNEAYKFLELLTGKKSEFGESDSTKNYWADVVANFPADAKISTVENEQRFVWGNKLSFTADFTQPTKIAKKLGPLQFIGPPGTAAKINEEILTLSAPADTNTLKLSMDSRACFNRPLFPARFRVSTQLGGGIRNHGTWTMGLCIGNLRVMFSPGTLGGELLFLRDDNGQAVHDYDQLGFTPTADLFHSMSIVVSQLNAEFVELEVNFADEGLSHKNYRNKIIVKRSDIGPIDRVMLLRSGGRGGDANFRNVKIVEEL